MLWWAFAGSAIATFAAPNDTGDTLHVDAGADVSTIGECSRGSIACPYLTLADVKNRIIWQHTQIDHDAVHYRNRIRRVQIHPGWYSPISIDHDALSGVEWRGAGPNLTFISGGIEIPRSRFKPWSNVTGAYIASIAGLGAKSLGAMITGNEVSDCQHDKVGLSYGGETMTLARWPNQAVPVDETKPWRWSRAVSGCSRTLSGNTLTVDINDSSDALRLLKWSSEKEPFVHGYWEWDWGDAYAPISKIDRAGDTIELSYRNAPLCKPGARWMGVNLLQELDAPREFYVDVKQQLVYFFPPDTVEQWNMGDGPPVLLMYQPGGVLNVTRESKNVTIADLAVVNGRHAGILAVDGVVGLQIKDVSVYAHGTHGIVLTGAIGGAIANCEVHSIGCSGIRATAGTAATLQSGELEVVQNHVHHVAHWKRSYMPGIYWGGVRNTFRRNIVEFHPHACFVGGGDFEDGVENVFEENILSVCVFETLDAGAFYSSGQQGTAFTNRGNVLQGNTFNQILNHAAGTGVQQASVQAVYLDDQQSGWTITHNRFTDCHVCSFIGGGRHNIVSYNVFIRCGTVQYLNNQGLTDPSLNGIQMINCTDVRPPFSTSCSTGAATWMATRAPAAVTWQRKWPEMTHVRSDYPGLPAHNAIINNIFCRNESAAVHEFISSNVDSSCPDFGANCKVVLSQWQITVSNNTETHNC